MSSAQDSSGEGKGAARIPVGRRTPHCPASGCHCDAVCGVAVYEGWVRAITADAGRLVMDDAYRSKTMYESERDALLGTQEQLRALRFAQLSGDIPDSEFFARFERVVDGMAS